LTLLPQCLECGVPPGDKTGRQLLAVEVIGETLRKRLVGEGVCTIDALRALPAKDIDRLFRQRGTAGPVYRDDDDLSGAVEACLRALPQYELFGHVCTDDEDVSSAMEDSGAEGDDSDAVVRVRYTSMSELSHQGGQRAGTGVLCVSKVGSARALLIREVRSSDGMTLDVRVPRDAAGAVCVCVRLLSRRFVGCDAAEVFVTVSPVGSDDGMDEEAS